MGGIIEFTHRTEQCLSLPPPQSGAVRRALQMAERFERTVNRTIRALRDLRRFSAPMNLPAGRVNISAAPEQLNG